MFAKPQPNRQTIQTNIDDVWETIEVYHRIVMIKKFPELDHRTRNKTGNIKSTKPGDAINGIKLHVLFMQVLTKPINHRHEEIGSMMTSQTYRLCILKVVLM